MVKKILKERKVRDVVSGNDEGEGREAGPVEGKIPLFLLKMVFYIRTQKLNKQAKSVL